MRISILETKIKEVKKGNKSLTLIENNEMKAIEKEYKKQNLVKFEDFYKFLVCEVSVEEDKIHTEIVSKALKEILNTDNSEKINDGIERLTEYALRIHHDMM